ncbi:MAG: signal peptidase II [Solirubrobacteraceae bacterium]|nr:signal peptidase II [Patulibacter sp.]
MTAAPSSGVFAHLRANRLAIVGATAVIVVDQVVKVWVRHDIPEGSARQFLPSIDLVRTRNTGVSFGILNSAPPWVVGLVSTVALVAVLSLVFGLLPGRVRQFAAALIVGGALGNLIDRIALGSVTDFLDLPLLPPCNVADIAITFGAIAMAIGLLLSGISERTTAQAGDEA